MLQYFDISPSLIKRLDLFLSVSESRIYQESHYAQSMGFKCLMYAKLVLFWHFCSQLINYFI